MKPAPEKNRIKWGDFATDASYGNNGVFYFGSPTSRKHVLRCIVSDEEGWEHVSVTVIVRRGRKPTRCPTWEEMCFIKDEFWHQHECVIQYHPPHSDYVSEHEFCLHLWKPVGITLPLPDPIMVGRPSFIKNKPS